MRAKGQVQLSMLTEIDPVKAIEAAMDGFRAADGAGGGDWRPFHTVTGCKDVISAGAFMKMKDGAIMCNAGHFNVEVDVKTLEKLAVEKQEQRPNIMGYKLEDGRWLYLLAEGRLVNLASGDGHPVEIMDMSFAIQALSAAYLARRSERLRPDLYPVPEEIDNDVAMRKLKAMGISIDVLTGDQRSYLDNWLK